MTPTSLHAAIFGAHAAKLQGTCVFLPFLLLLIIIIIIRGQAAKLQNPIVFVRFPIIRGQAAKLQNPIVFVRFPIIIIIILPLESMAAHRTPCSKVMKFGTLIHDSPIRPPSKFEVASPWALAPPIGQSWTCIHVNNFWPIHSILTNKASLESQGGVLRSSISWLARCVELKAWVSCPTKVALF